jgi:DNA-binding XRE family transcriptional regulator
MDRSPDPSKKTRPTNRTRPQRYCRCGTRLAADNPGSQCAGCQRAHRDKYLAPPHLPPQFWATEQLSAAFTAQHIGHIARAYRLHPHHLPIYGRDGISQAILGHWLGLSQPQISRIENGPPIRNLDTLAHWARTLHLPTHLLWFDHPGTKRTPTPTHATTQHDHHEPAPPPSTTKKQPHHG